MPLIFLIVSALSFIGVFFGEGHTQTQALILACTFLILAHFYAGEEE